MEKLHYDIMELKSRLKTVRTKTGIDLATAAKSLHLSLVTARNYESSDKTKVPSLEYILFIAEQSNYPIDYFFAADEEYADILQLFRHQRARERANGEKLYDTSHLHEQLKNMHKKLGNPSWSELLDLYDELFGKNIETTTATRYEAGTRKPPLTYMIFLANQSDSLIESLFVKEENSRTLASFISSIQAELHKK